MPIKHIILFLGIYFLSLQVGFTQPANKTVKLPKPTDPAQNWVDSIYASLSIEQKIGQLFMVAAYSGGEKYNQPLIEKLIRENGIGGLIFMQGTPPAQATQTNLYQHLSKTPLLIAMDAEWGLGMRLTGVRDMPRQIMLGAMKDSTLVYKMASAIANQCRRLGVHVDFAPVVDINNNPNNPVINFRSFGENKYKVANYALQYMRGLQDNGIMACGKHFPGHGDTETDSHKDLPEINKSLAELKNLELYPFQSMIDNGIQSMMVAHLQVPALDKKVNTPTTLSNNTITNLLKNDMHFKGLVFTDALNMQGIAKYYTPGDIDLKAFQAGNDVLLFSQDVPTGVEKIKDALDEGLISTARLEESVKKILLAKYQAGLYSFKNIDTTSITEDLNQYISPIRQQVAEAAITLLNDPYQVIDRIKRNATKKIMYVGIGTSSETHFTKKLKDYGIADIRFAPTNPAEIKSFIRELNQAEAIVVGIHNLTGYPNQNFGLDKNEMAMIQEINQLKKSIFVLFGNPYAVKNFCDTKGLMITYDEATETQEAAAKIITGQIKTKGKLPVTICPNYGFGEGIVSLTNPLGEVLDTVKYSKQNKTIQQDPRFQSSNLFKKDLPLECCVSPNALGINIQELDKLDDYLASSV
ncbi:MAG: glycoside hydrolase family 3 C-terminal domain-containing protein, partial [Chitinophagaceae bacterium]|nr:glycoside hydrolase family 3 C-terminal domain-containing protein [Chitinophagaceae bacterium]